MKKIIKNGIFALVSLTLIISCYDVLENENNIDTATKEGITKKEAAAVFQQRIYDFEELKNKGNLPVNFLLSANYTPQWDKAVTGENEYIWSIEAPIIDSRRLVATSHLNEPKPWEAAVTQKVVVIKSKETQNTEMFLLSLIPDRTCFEQYKHHRGRTYTHVGDTRRFSGTAIYTLWEGTNVLINEHKEGRVTQKFKYDRNKLFSEQQKIWNDVISETGDVVLMSDEWYLGEIEGSVCIGSLCDKIHDFYCPFCRYPISNCHCGIDGGGGSDGSGGDYFPPGYPDPGDGGNNNPPPQPTKYTVTISVAGNGTVTGNGTSASNINGAGVYEYNKGTYLSITAVADNGYKFTGWQGDVSGTSSSIWIDNLSKNMSVTANFASKAEPYTARPDDKKFKNNFVATMQTQLANTCVTSIMTYINTVLCGTDVNEGIYVLDYQRTHNKWVFDEGVSSEHVQSFMNKYFVSTDFTSWQVAINAGRFVFTDVPSDISGSNHAVLVVGYGADGSLIYMDPEAGSLMRADADYITGSQKIVINKCQ
jgi:uncharacterized repeat protein (TIGR02543 family)